MSETRILNNISSQPAQCLGAMDSGIEVLTCDVDVAAIEAMLDEKSPHNRVGMSRSIGDQIIARYEGLYQARKAKE